jgi:hypothetical protein
LELNFLFASISSALRGKKRTKLAPAIERLGRSKYFRRLTIDGGFTGGPKIASCCTRLRR